MRIVPTKIKLVRTDLWREGAWLDLWSVVHVLSGLLLGFFFYYLDIHAIFGVLLAVLVLTVYELFEMFVEIYEAPTNRFMDVVVGIVGYLLAFFLISPLLAKEYLVLTFVCMFIVNSVMSIIGWRASQKAAAFQKRVHARIAINRQRLKERKAAFRSKHHF
jgi:uncharacterized protein YacL